MASSFGDVAMIKALLGLGARLDAETPSGFTAVHLAAANGHLAALRLFHATGLSTSFRAYDHLTPLHCAAAEGHSDCAAYLLANGADPHCTTLQGGSIGVFIWYLFFIHKFLPYRAIAFRVG